MGNPLRDSGSPDIGLVWFQEVYRHEEEGTSGMTGTFTRRWVCLAEHFSTGVFAVSWQHKSRMKNKQHALEMLRLKLEGAL